MSNKMNNENLHELVANLYPPEQAAQIEEDICKGDGIIATSDSLTADPVVIDNIKNAISAKLTTRSRRRMNTISLRTAIAAMIAIVAFLGIRNIVHQTSSPVAMSFTIGSFWGEDATASVMSDELDSIENDIILIGLDELETESDVSIDNMDFEIFKTDSNFWRS